MRKILLAVMAIATSISPASAEDLPTFEVGVLSMRPARRHHRSGFYRDPQE